RQRHDRRRHRSRARPRSVGRRHVADELPRSGATRRASSSSGAAGASALARHRNDPRNVRSDGPERTRRRSLRQTRLYRGKRIGWNDVLEDGYGNAARSRTDARQARRIMNAYVARHRFDDAEQERFASATGDFNPMHMDPIAARRTQAGAPVVHGIHYALWAIDALVVSGRIDRPIAS